MSTTVAPAEFPRATGFSGKATSGGAGDPLEYFQRASVSFTTLLEHGAASLRDLFSLCDDKIRISYLKDGELVVEAATRLQLLERADALGWRPWAAVEDEQVSFYDALPFHDEVEDMRWFCGEGTYDEDGGFPLALPTDRLDVLRAEWTARIRAVQEKSIHKEARGVYLRSLDAEPPALTMEAAVALVRQWRAEAAPVDRLDAMDGADD